jgi:hypothetical protein
VLGEFQKHRPAASVFSVGVRPPGRLGS